MGYLDRLSTFRSSFQFKLFSVFTLLTAAATILLGALFITIENTQIRRQETEKLQLQTNALADSVRLTLYAENIDALQESAREVQNLAHVRGVEISAANGRLLVRLPAELRNESGTITTSAEVRSSRLTPSAAMVMGSGQHQPEAPIGTVRLYRESDDIARSLRGVALTAGSVGLLFWLLVSGACYLLLQRVTRSFQSLIQGLKNLHAGDYTSRIDVTTDDEPGRASMSVNVLAEELRRREEENQRLDTERELARQELKQLVAQLPVGIIWSNSSGQIEYLNNFVVEKFGYQPREITTLDEWFSHICPDDGERRDLIEARRAEIDACGDGDGAARYYPARVVCKGGTFRHLLCSNQVSGGRVVDIMLDMTDHELLQQQLIRNEKLEAVGVLAGGIAHNFNNALTGVMGFISFARRFLDESHQAHPHLLSAEKASLRAAGLATQLLTFAKGGAPIKRPASVTRLAEEALSLSTSGSRVAGRLELPASLHPVMIDEGQICQAFNCICINAVQAMPDGGLLTIRGRNVSTDQEKLPVPAAGDYVELSFEDQGCGIQEKDRDKIFLPYFTTKANVGTGLGLATTYSIISRHGGAISFTSEAGAGTTFTLYLPAARPSSAGLLPDPPLETADLTAPASCGSCGSLLVMDDDAVIRELAKTVLEECGYRVSVCENGEETVERYCEARESGTPFRAAILDLTIPGGGMDGKETAQRILAYDPDACLIVSSGYSQNEVMKNFRSYGFCAAVTKPYQADDLAQILLQLQRQQQV